MWNGVSIVGVEICGGIMTFCIFLAFYRCNYHIITWAVILCLCVSSGLAKPDFSDMPGPFDTEAFNRLYRGTYLIFLYACLWKYCTHAAASEQNQPHPVRPSNSSCLVVYLPFCFRLSPCLTPICVFAVIPVRKVHALTITWALPPQEKHYRWAAKTQVVENTRTQSRPCFTLTAEELHQIICFPFIMLLSSFRLQPFHINAKLDHP